MAGARYLFFTRGMHGVCWRLVASNNREIARSPEPAQGLDAVVAEIDSLRHRAETALARLVRESATVSSPAGWRWQVHTADSTLLAVSSRAYLRRLECEVALAQFRAIAPTAEAQLVIKSRA